MQALLQHIFFDGQRVGGGGGGSWRETEYIGTSGQNKSQICCLGFQDADLMLGQISSPFFFSLPIPPFSTFLRFFSFHLFTSIFHWNGYAVVVPACVSATSLLYSCNLINQ